MIDNLGESGRLVVAYARRIAANLRDDSVRPEHLFLGIGDLEDLALRKGLEEAGVDLDEACGQLRRKLSKGGGLAHGNLPLSSQSEQVLDRASAEAGRAGDGEVEAHHLLGALLADDGAIAGVVRDQGADPTAVRQKLTGIVDAGETTPSEFYKTRRNVEQAGLGKTAEVLESLGRDLTKAARDGKLSPIIGRDREIDELVKVLLGKRKHNALLLGDAGVGKTAVVEGLAQRIVADQVPGIPPDTTIRTIEVGSLVAGTVFRGQFEQRLKDLVDGVRDRDDVILFIDEMHMLVGAGESGLSGSVDAANMLKPVLSEGSLKVIGATTLDEYRKNLESDTALARRFQRVIVGEPSREDTLTILRGLREKYEEFHTVKIADDALEAAVDLSTRYIADRFLPDKALDLLDRACTEDRLEAARAEESDEPPTVDADDIAEVVSMQLEIPIARLTSDERTRLAGMADAIKEQVVGQDQAVEAITQAIVRARTGFGNPDRPVGVFFFLGPSGVGKTKLAEAVAAFLFGDAEELVNLDMSQYLHAHSVSELIGTGPGYVGWSEGGKLTNAVRAKPHSVVLLDEMEKADPAVWNLFLPIFDNGRIADGLGREIDFRNSVIVMTANVGSRRFQTQFPVGFAAPGGPDSATAAVPFENVEHDVREDLKDLFPPEFLNRVDEIVVFRPLGMDEIRGIVRRRIAETVIVHLDISDGALELLAKESYDPAMGARPVRRCIQRLVANPLSLMMAKGEITEGATVRVDASDSELTFTPAKARRAKSKPAS